MGIVALEGLKFHAYIGLYKEEKSIGNDYLVDIYIETEIKNASIKEDQLSGTIDYEKVYHLVKKEMSSKANLLEFIADNIITTIKNEFSTVKNIKVRISKLNPPIKGEINRVFIELSKSF